MLCTFEVSGPASPPPLLRTNACISMMFTYFSRENEQKLDSLLLLCIGKEREKKAFHESAPFLPVVVLSRI